MGTGVFHRICDAMKGIFTTGLLCHGFDPRAPG